MSRQIATSLWLGFRQLVLPGVCLSCHRLLSPEAADFCAECVPQFSLDPFLSCPRCSSTVGPHIELAEGCPECRRVLHAFERAIRWGPYRGLLRDLVLRMKHPGQEGLAEAIGECWAERAAARLGEFGAQIVVPIPLHWRRRWKRGFNPSDLLAQAVARRLQLPYFGRALHWVRSTRHQGFLPPTQRRLNVKGALRACLPVDVRGKSVLLIDDVMTTGATAHEAAKALREGGAAKVYVAVLAHDGSLR